MTYTTVQGRNNNPSTPATCHSHEIIAISKPQWFNQCLVDKCIYLDGCNESWTHTMTKKENSENQVPPYIFLAQEAVTRSYT